MFSLQSTPQPCSMSSFHSPSQAILLLAQQSTPLPSILFLIHSPQYLPPSLQQNVPKPWRYLPSLQPSYLPSGRSSLTQRGWLSSSSLSSLRWVQVQLGRRFSFQQRGYLLWWSWCRCFLESTWVWVWRILQLEQSVGVLGLIGLYCDDLWVWCYEKRVSLDYLAEQMSCLSHSSSTMHSEQLASQLALG